MHFEFPLTGLDPEVRAFIDGLAARGDPPISSLTPEQARAVQSDLQGGAVQAYPAQVEDRVIPAGPSGEINVRIIRPGSATSNLPAIMCFHGGGWVIGDRATHDRFMREISHATGAGVVYVDYTRSPEARFPTAIEQAYAATCWIAEHRRGGRARRLPCRCAGRQCGRQHGRSGQPARQRT